jgi:hypothetical protein
MLDLRRVLLEHKYVMGSVDKTLFTLNHGTDLYKWSVPVSFLTIERTGAARPPEDRDKVSSHTPPGGRRRGRGSRTAPITR